MRPLYADEFGKLSSHVTTSRTMETRSPRNWYHVMLVAAAAMRFQQLPSSTCVICSSAKVAVDEELQVMIPSSAGGRLRTASA